MERILGRLASGRDIEENKRLKFEFDASIIIELLKLSVTVKIASLIINRANNITKIYHYIL
jgi:hypothetical protein